MKGKILIIICLGVSLIPYLLSCERQQAQQLTLPEPPKPAAANSSEDGLGDASTIVLDRDGYTAIDLEQLPASVSLTGDDPKAIALAAFGTKEPIEGQFEQEVLVTTETAQQVIVTITQLGLPDDSIKGLRYRVEFQPETASGGSQWQMIWAGRQQTCQPGRGSPDWTKDPCR